jgi:hypothetical protein
VGRREVLSILVGRKGVYIIFWSDGGERGVSGGLYSDNVCWGVGSPYLIYSDVMGRSRKFYCTFSDDMVGRRESYCIYCKGVVGRMVEHLALPNLTLNMFSHNQQNSTNPWIGWAISLT